MRLRKRLMSKKIIFTGGGTSGHVLPNFPLIEQFLENKYIVEYIGSKDGIEKELIEKNFPDVKYYSITSDKLRRYLTYKHIFVPFRVVRGLVESILLLKKLKPDFVFSKGSFVSVPIVLASWILRIPVAIHESDYSVGLANKLAFPFAKLIFVSFNKSIYSEKYQNKMIQTGPLIRKSFLNLQKPDDIEIHFENDKKTILIFGGSLGAQNINTLVYNNFAELVKRFNIIHICGKNNTRNNLIDASYISFEYLNDGISYLMSISDLIISRAGMNSIWEILMMGKPNILIPLSAKKSRGDQIENAKYFEKLGLSKIINDDNLDFQNLLHQIEGIFNNYKLYLDGIKNFNLVLGNTIIYDSIIKIMG